MGSGLASRDALRRSSSAGRLTGARTQKGQADPVTMRPRRGAGFDQRMELAGLEPTCDLENCKRSASIRLPRGAYVCRIRTPRCEQLGKPEVTGSIPVRSTELGSAAVARNLDGLGLEQCSGRLGCGNDSFALEEFHGLSEDRHCLRRPAE